MAVAERPATMKQSICRRSVSSYCTRRFSNLLVGGGGKKKFYFSRFFFSFLLVFDPLLRPTLFLSSNGLMTLSAPLSGHTPTISRQLL